MLKAIDPTLTPDLLWALAAMGHGDTLAIVDANYPAHTLHSRVITLAGVDMANAMTAICIDSHTAVSTILTAAEERSIEVAPVERTEFYAQAKKAFAVVLTGELSSFACFLVTKGVVASVPTHVAG